MTTLRMTVVFSFWLSGLSSLMLSVQAPKNPSDALLDVLVFGTHVPIDPQAYTGELRTEVNRYLSRANAYRSTTPPPPIAEGEMVRAAWETYERKLVSISADPSASALAVAYVKDLRPCYEWEGSHDCPEREARFADEYQAAHPNGPFSGYLPLLAAHRWLCAAEGYEYETQPVDAERSRRLYRQRLVVAQASRLLLVRVAAERLGTRGTCLAPR